MLIKQTFIHDWPTPPEWQEELESVAPKQGDLSYLKLEWEPGEEWRPIQRWVIYQMIPLGDNPADDLFLPLLQGPNPRRYGYYDEVQGVYVRQRGAPPISMHQWQLYQETGRLGQPYWVIQGDEGGHRYDFTKTEKMIISRKTGQKNVEAPRAGSLPYAPFDNRVRNKLANLDRLRKDEFAVAFGYKHPEEFERAEEEALRNAENDVWEWLKTQVDDRLRNVPYGFVSRMAGLDPAPRIFNPGIRG